MAAKVCVKRVVIDYVAEGRAFTIELDPMMIGSIVFDPVDLQRAQEKQNELAKVPDSGVPAVKEPPDTFLKFGPIPASRGVKTMDELTDTAGVDLSEEGPSLWWHTNNCIWLHPAGQG
jgi:hypothetical protein